MDGYFGSEKFLTLSIYMYGGIYLGIVPKPKSFINLAAKSKLIYNILLLNIWRRVGNEYLSYKIYKKLWNHQRL